MIQIENLTKIFHSAAGEVTALREVSFSIEDGDVFGIIGMSGAGKSTLLRCLSMLEQPTSGRILLDGVDLASLRGKQLLAARRRMGVVFQGYHLLMQKSVRENVAFPLRLAGVRRAEREARVDELLELVGLADKANAYPAQLSGGQRQRVAIARALATNPQVLLCDEPTSALDPLTTRQVLELLRELNQRLGVTIVVITHEIAVVREICNKVAVIDAAQFAEGGRTDEIFAKPASSITRLLLGVEGGRKHA